MSAAGLSPDPTRCPACGVRLVHATACRGCSLRLTGPAAQRLWEVDTELLRLAATRRELVVERAGLLDRLRGTEAAAVPDLVAAPLAPTTVPARAEWTTQRVQNTLLALGALLLAVAGVVFTAVTYDRLGAGGRAAVLVVLTLLAGAAVPLLLRRGLGATAETLTAVALVLAALDAYGLRRLGVLPGLDALPYAALSAAVLSVVSASFAHLVPVRLAGAAAVVAAQLPVPLLLVHAEAAPAAAGLVLAGLAAADLAALAGLTGRVRGQVIATLAASAGAVVLVGLLTSLDGAATDEPGLGALALAAHAAVLAGASLLLSSGLPRLLLSAAPVPVLAAAAFSVARPELTSAQLPLVVAAVGFLAVQTAHLLPDSWRPGPVTGGLAVSAAAVLGVAEPAVSGLLLPLTWLTDPWTLSGAESAREAVGVASTWDGSVVAPVVLATAALALATAGLVLHRLREVGVLAAGSTVAAVLLLPLGLDVPYLAGLGLLVAVGTAAVAAGLLVLPSLRPALVVTGAGVALFAAVWSLADQGATLVVVGACALLLTTVAARPTGLSTAFMTAATATTAVLGTAWLVAAGAAQGLATDQVGGLLLLAPAVLLVAAVLLDPARRSGVEPVAVGGGLVAAVLASGDAGWLSWVLAGCAVLALATALRPDRRPAAVVGGLLLTASSWVRLGDAGVTAPEPYVLPLAAIALLLGHLRRRTDPLTPSWSAYGPGLSLLLIPSLLASFDDRTLTRPLLVGLTALVVLLLGARSRLQAPLALGGAVLAVDALQLLAPYAAALPRWMPLALAGALLVGLGATYEQRRRDLDRLRDRYDALG